ncbi:hypothetical protein [Methylocapsa acidiphila]|uniref:hypothetical protein n=1 Tax=Methylocapsa acidiphila TaxID=133552 RepID=UPI000408D915|nr:hypothetical protein [Methylocapsa acidiphila]
MDELIARISAAAGLEPEVAKQAIGLILGYLRKEGPQADVDELFAAFPGAAEAVVLNGSAPGDGPGGLMGLAGRLSNLGIGMGQMQTIGRQVFAFAREAAGDERVGQVVAAIPGLSQFL